MATITTSTPSTSNLGTSGTGVVADVSAPGAVDPKAAAAALAKQIDQLKKEGKTAEATKMLNELNTFKGQEQTVALLSIGLVNPTDTLVAGEPAIPGNFLSTESNDTAAPTDGSSNWTSDFENLLDRLPTASGTSATAGSRFGLEDVAGRALPAMFLSGASGAALTGAAQVDHPGLVNMSADVNVRSEQVGRIETFKSYERITQTFWSKMGSDEAAAGGSSLAAGMPAHAMQPLKVAQAKIADAFKTYMSLPSGKSTAGTGASAAASTAAAGDQVPDIPGPQITQMESAAQTVVGLGSAISSQVAANAGLGLSSSQQVFGIITQNGETPASAGGANGVVTSNLSGATVGTTVMSAGVDIDSLMIVVMMDATNVEDDMLADQLNEMQQMTDQKKQMRAINDQMKQSEAALSGQMQTEFAQGQADGDIAPSITFDQYSAWRNCQYANVNDQTNTDGSHSISWPAAQLEEPCPPIPDWMHTGTVAAASTSSSDASGSVDLSSTYGLPPQAEAMLRKIFNAMDPSTKASYSDFNDYISSLGFVQASSIQDITDNLTTLQSAVSDAQNASKDSVTDASTADTDAYNAAVRAYNEANPVVLSADLFKNPTFVASLDTAMQQYALSKMMTGTGAASAYAAMAPDPTQITVDVPGQTPEMVPLSQLMTANQDPAFAAAYQTELGKQTDKINIQTAALATIISSLKTPPSDIASVQAALRTNLGPLLAKAQKDGLGAGDVGSGSDGNVSDGSSSSFDDDIFKDHGGLLSNVFGDLGQGFTNAWDSLWGSGDVTSAIDTNSVSFGSDGVGVNVTSTQHNSWPASDDHQTQTCTIPLGSSSFLGQLQTAMAGIPPLTGDSLTKFINGIADQNAPMPSMTGKVCDATNPADGGPGLPPDPNDPKYTKGLMKTSQFSSDSDKVGQWLKDIDSPDSVIRRLDAANHTDGSVVPQAATDIAAAQAAAAAVPTNAQGQILGNTGTLAQLTAYQGTIEDNLQNLGDMSDIMQMKLQASMDRRSKFLEALSNMIKKVSDTTDAIVQNMK